MNKRVPFALLMLVTSTALIFAQTPATGTITINSSLSAVGTSTAETLTCTIAPTATRSGVTVACTHGPVASQSAMAQHNEDVSLPGQSNTWQLNLAGNALSVMLTQSAPTGTITYQVNMNGTAKAGTF